MSTFDHDGARIYFEEHGKGFPVLVIAPGGMRSAVPLWDKQPWNPIRDLATRFRVIAMDQRNAGQSTAPIRATDSWDVYARDQLALMDHLGIQRFLVLGMCIGGSYCMGLAQAAPERVAGAVLMQPIGLHDNRQAFFDMFDQWAAVLKAHGSDVPSDAWDSFKQSMYGGDFLFSVSRQFAARCQTPILVLCGRDLYHPEAISREIVRLAPHAELIEYWKEPENLDAAGKRIIEFLTQNSGA